MGGVLTFSEKRTRLPSSAKKHPIWHFCCSQELIFAELGKKAPFSEKGAVITGALILRCNIKIIIIISSSIIMKTVAQQPQQLFLKICIAIVFHYTIILTNLIC
jgi:hypothetical protein